MSKPRRRLRLGTDCTGIDAPLAALSCLGVDVDYRFSSEIDSGLPPCRWKTPKVAYGNLLQRDNKKAPQVDLYVAGFPCQPSSSLSGDARGLGDAHGRGRVMDGVIDYIRKQRPGMFLLENVRAFLTNGKGEAWRKLRGAISRCGCYDLYHRVISPTALGFPHSRPRVFIVGIQKRFKAHEVWPPESSRPGEETRLRDLLLSKREARRVCPYAFRDPCPSQQAVLDRFRANARAKGISLRNTCHILDLTRTRRDDNGYLPSPDVVHCMHLRSGNFYLSQQERFVTPQEALRFQGFPDDFHDTEDLSQACKWAGNSMCVPVVAAILKPYLEQMGFLPKRGRARKRGTS